MQHKGTLPKVREALSDLVDAYEGYRETLTSLDNFIEEAKRRENNGHRAAVLLNEAITEVHHEPT
tara:strand:+ start:240 stop:434 length:195 start_codon:yes stop_codon:yes gene_type:complete